MSVRSLYPNASQYYLIAMDAQGELYTLVSSDETGSNDMSGEWQFLNDASIELDQVFSSATEAVVGPIFDGNGTWIKAYLPLIDVQTWDVVAVLGMDIDADQWVKQLRDDLQAPETILAFSVLFGWLIFFVLLLRAHFPEVLRRKKWSRYALAILSIMVGLSVSFLLIWYGWYFENNSRRDAFERLAAAKAGAIYSIFHHVDASSLTGLKQLFESSDFVSRREFHEFAQTLGN